MRISAKAEYACLAIIALAQLGLEQTPVRIREIADKHDIPERYLVQILLQLKGAGLVYSSRGAAGGYRLARSPDRISLGEVLSAIDGPGEPAKEAHGDEARALARVWEHIRNTEREVLSQTSIAELIGKVVPPDWVI